MEKKIVLTFYDSEGDITEEKVWAEKMEENIYQLKNIPFFAPNVAFNDVVSVENENGILHFDAVVTTSEHSTIQIVFFNTDKIDNVIKQIEEFECAWEGMNDQRLIAVDVPPQINYTVVKRYLNLQLSNKVLDYKEACLSDTHKKLIASFASNQ
ncbi:MAG TPA: DUF4265 domain-containing protein [Niabella sp.]|nr:DUF4265 domain-containing protein [Niabella sp.]